MTIWMAVDSAGFVGLFDRRQNGAMPERAAQPGELDTFPLDALRFARAMAVARKTLASSEDTKTGRVLVVVDGSRVEAPSSYREAAPRSGVEEALGASAWVVREATPRILASLEPLPAASLEAIARDPSTLDVLDEAEVRAWLARVEGDTGVYRWWCPGDDDDAYVRGESPSDPIRSRELPTELRRALERTRIRVTFGTTRGVSLRRSAGPKRGSKKKTGPMRSREDREWDALVARSRSRPAPLYLRAIAYLAVGGLAFSVVLLFVIAVINALNDL